jgi:hypothetical protein
LLASSLSKSVDGGLTANYVGGYSGPFGIHPDIQDLEFVVIQLSCKRMVALANRQYFSSATNWKSTCKGLDIGGLILGFNTDQMGGKYHNGNDFFQMEQW